MCVSVWDRVEHFGKTREKERGGRVSERQRKKEDCFLLRNLESHGGGLGDAAFSTLEVKYERREGKWREREKTSESDDSLSVGRYESWKTPQRQ